MQSSHKFHAIYLLDKIEILSMHYLPKGHAGTKGISPLVASVLLIAATMSIAAILAYWASSFVKTSLPEINKTQQECQFADFTIYQCNYQSSTKELDLVINNIRTIQIQQLQVFVFDANGTPGSSVPLNGTIDPGSFQPFPISGVSANFSKIVVTSKLCPDLLKESACSRS